ncbi:MAG TPA: choice-of-anchor tandem repeat GloVer-containing protein [Rhizomicrobium sp.]|nr:choice-of-anchor tandem repeat GloVer-containing protein [Rhizomicrobium sp.]
MKTVSIALLAGLLGSACVQPDPAAQASAFKERVLYSFCSQQYCTDGADPMAGLIDVKGTFYGTAAGGGIGNLGSNEPGVVFSINPRTGAEKVIYYFCSQGYCPDGEVPMAGLIYVRGILYGTTQLGGTFNGGTVFSIDPNTGAEAVLYSFCRRRVRKTECADGAAPVASLIEVNGILYGTTEYGGNSKRPRRTNGYGIVFSVNPRTGAEKVLHNFTGGTDGARPTANLVDVNGILYGTTEYGGADNDGTVFSLDPSTGAETVLHAFVGTDGSIPAAGLIDVNGILYGTTVTGGTPGGHGTVFAIDPDTGTETVLYSFSGGTDGAEPFASLSYGSGTLYGTTYLGGGTGCGQIGCGTAFALDPDTGAETVLYSFCNQQNYQNCIHGFYPTANLIDVKGRLYGTTDGGGIGTEGNCDDGCGTVFVLNEK